jgi:hypothetical protein
MATAHNPPLNRQRARPFVERWFFTSLAIMMIVVSIAGFAPAIVSPAGRRAPLTLLASVHGVVFLAWLLLFLAQSLLAATGRIGLHRRLGLASVVLLALMISSGFLTTTAMVRRGFDLSGDQHIELHPHLGRTLELDGYTASVFNFGALLTFAVLAIAAIYYRRRPEVHKRLMLFANVALMGPPITHFIGHTPPLALTPVAVLIPFTLFLLAGVSRDYLVSKRINPLTIGLAIVLFVSFPLEGALIGPSAAWHQFAAWISQ